MPGTVIKPNFSDFFVRLSRSRYIFRRMQAKNTRTDYKIIQSLREIYHTLGNFLIINFVERDVSRLSYNRVTNKTIKNVRYISISLGCS